MSLLNEIFEEVLTDCGELSSEYSDSSNVEEPGPTSSDSSQVRDSRSVRRQRGSRRRRGNRTVPTTNILMPTNKFHNITDLVDPKLRCGSKTKLITLRTNHREYKLVERQMQNTIIVDDKNCESTGGCYDKFNIVRIQKVLQGCAWRRYISRKQDIQLATGLANERMLFHGTDAVWNVVQSGFDERFASTNGSFGAGLYFTQHSSIANKFIFGYFGGNGCAKHEDKNCFICERHLLLCRVTLGSEHKLENTQNMPHPPPGFDSVTAVPAKDGFEYSEYVIYRGEQAYPEYLITYKIVKKESFTPDTQGQINKDGGQSQSHYRDVDKFNRRL